MSLDYKEKVTTEVTMRPVCECGHVFKELRYNKSSKMFFPKECPNCNRTIVNITFYDPSKYIPNEDGVIILTD